VPRQSHHRRRAANVSHPAIAAALAALRAMTAHYLVRACTHSVAPCAGSKLATQPSSGDRTIFGHRLDAPPASHGQYCATNCCLVSGLCGWNPWQLARAVSARQGAGSSATAKAITLPPPSPFDRRRRRAWCSREGACRRCFRNRTRAVKKIFVEPAGALPVPVSEILNCRALIARFSPAEAGFTAGQSSFYCRPRPAARLLPISPEPNPSAYGGDEKVANRDIRVWHGATEKGP
jgi:hypothetical protein